MKRALSSSSVYSYDDIKCSIIFVDYSTKYIYAGSFHSNDVDDVFFWFKLALNKNFINQKIITLMLTMEGKTNHLRSF